MKQNITEILKEALKLPPEARAALAGALLDSLDESIVKDAEKPPRTPVSLGVGFSLDTVKDVQEVGNQADPWGN